MNSIEFRCSAEIDAHSLIKLNLAKTKVGITNVVYHSPKLPSDEEDANDFGRVVKTG